MPSRFEQEYTLPSSTKAQVADQASKLAVIVTHPWGPLGGSMHNNVVMATCLYFQKLGLTTVRFDFCGSQLGRGLAQVEQVQQIAASLLAGDYTREEEGNQPPTKLLLIGYSYGSLIAGSATADLPNCVASISIAPPFAVQNWLLMFHAQYHLERWAQRTDLPRLLVIGNKDNFTSEGKFKESIKTYFPEDCTTGAVIKDCDHFFARRERDVMDVIMQWLRTTFPQCQKDLRNLRNVDFEAESP